MLPFSPISHTAPQDSRALPVSVAPKPDFEDFGSTTRFYSTAIGSRAQKERLRADATAPPSPLVPSPSLLHIIHRYVHRPGSARTELRYSQISDMAGDRASSSFLLEKIPDVVQALTAPQFRLELCDTIYFHPSELYKLELDSCFRDCTDLELEGAPPRIITPLITYFSSLLAPSCQQRDAILAWLSFPRFGSGPLVSSPSTI
ncbi:hypothetical protein K438DRAFT_1986298 [Mycena galopus ATCC 62051]|nr:hypothetical protein K438DRAFT_1986298 [Mycena galopus ATCC 62051]